MRGFKGFSAAVLILCAVLSTKEFLSPGLAVAQPSDFLIVPGERIGLVRIEMAISDAVAVLRRYGRAKHVDSSGGCAVWWDGPAEEAIVCVHDRFSHGRDVIQTPGRVGKIVTNSRKFATASGLRVGTRIEKVTGGFGKPDWIEPFGPGAYLEWHRLGLAVFQFEDKIMHFLVVPPRKKT